MINTVNNTARLAPCHKRIIHSQADAAIINSEVACQVCWWCVVCMAGVCVSTRVPTHP